MPSPKQPATPAKKAAPAAKAATKPAGKAAAPAKRKGTAPAKAEAAAKAPALQAMAAAGQAAAPVPAAAPAPATAVPGVGDAMPAFSLAATDGTTVSAGSLRGAPYILYFYPKDSTPGCTTEACDFRDHLGHLAGAGVKVFGVSPDSLKSHAKFIASQGLTFPLLSDPDHALASALGAWITKSMYGRSYLGIDRSTFLVDAQGRIAQAWRGVKVPGHVEAVVAAAKALTGA